MAEMTAKQAIAVLHNNQYQKHLGNGEYDYIHPLTDAEAKAIEELIQQQDKMLELAVTQIIDISGVCPLNCDTRCDSLVVVKQLPDCWRKYLQSEVEK